MPELPEVETTKEGIKTHIESQVISKVIVRNFKLRLPVAVNINDLCENKLIKQVSRRAKYILLELSPGNLLIHLGMSGHLRVVPAHLAPGKHDHVDLILKNNLALRYCDPRRFGLFHYFNEEPRVYSLLARLGPEPLTPVFNADYLYQKTRRKNQPIKSLIMNNELVVGVGNIYAAESLFLAGINPQNPAKTLSYDQCSCLVKQIKQVLLSAIDVGGTTLKDFYAFDGKPGYFNNSLKVYGRKKQPCFDCNTLIETTVIAGRHSCFCPKCQPLFVS